MNCLVFCIVMVHEDLAVLSCLLSLEGLKASTLAHTLMTWCLLIPQLLGYLKDKHDMGFRTVYITARSRCSYKNGYLVVRQEQQTMIHLSEIEKLIVESTAVYLSSYLMCELAQSKIPVVFCDLQHNPIGEYLPLYGAHDSSKRIQEQISWDKSIRAELWALIVKSKIKNQAIVLEELGKPETAMLKDYADQVQPGI